MTDEGRQTLNSIEAEFLDIFKKNKWSIVFQKIGQISRKYPFTSYVAKAPFNKHLNRYRDVNPYDYTRIKLERIYRDYINANLVKMDRVSRSYILTQGPLECTVSHFWLMVWEQNTKAILMLNKLVENNETKCYKYWPEMSFGQVFEDVKLIVELISEEEDTDFVIRKFRLTDTASLVIRDVIQFQYTTWPDFSVPSSPSAFLSFLAKVRSSGALERDVGPPIVHCSAGIGRSGTFCLVDSCLAIIEKEGFDNLKVQSVLLELRRGRMGLVQTSEQLRFSYIAIIEGVKIFNPNYVVNSEVAQCISVYADEDRFYNKVEEEAPPPPPRGESLTRAPARPLPAIPTSSSLGNISYAAAHPALPSPPITISSDSEEDVQMIVKEPPLITIESDSDEGQEKGAGDGAGEIDSSLGSGGDGAGEVTSPGVGTGADGESADDVAGGGEGEGAGKDISAHTLRQRKREKMEERIAIIKKRAHAAEMWIAFKRSIFKKLTMTFSLVVAGIVIYTYVKH